MSTVIVSKRKDFNELSLVAEAWVPSCDTWVGDFPYLKRPSFQSYIAAYKRYQQQREIPWVDVGMGTEYDASGSRAEKFPLKIPEVQGERKFGRSKNEGKKTGRP